MEVFGWRTSGEVKKIAHERNEVLKDIKEKVVSTLLDVPLLTVHGIQIQADDVLHILLQPSQFRLCSLRNMKTLNHINSGWL